MNTYMANISKRIAGARSQVERYAGEVEVDHKIFGHQIGGGGTEAARLRVQESRAAIDRIESRLHTAFEQGRWI